MLLRYFLLLAAILIILVEVTCYFIVSKTTEDQTRDRLVRAGREISELASASDEDGISRIIREYRKEGIIAYVLSSEGSIILPIEEQGIEWGGNVERLKQRIQSLSGARLFSLKAII